MSSTEGVSPEAPSSRSGRSRRRGAVVVTLALGLAGGSAGTGFAVTGVEATGQSALDGQAGLPDVGDSPRLASRPSAVVSGERAAGAAPRGTSGARLSPQEPRQLWAVRRDGGLPLTGRAAIPVLLALALAGAGLMLRRA